jgi:hypothetical protein
MIHYQPLKNQKLKLQPKATIKFDKTPAILVPTQPGRVFLHWYNQNDKLMKTLTLEFATKIFEPVNIISGHDSPIEIIAIELDKTY